MCQHRLCIAFDLNVFIYMLSLFLQELNFYNLVVFPYPWLYIGLGHTVFLLSMLRIGHNFDLGHPDITIMVDWALKINYLSIFELGLHMK